MGCAAGSARTQFRETPWHTFTPSRVEHHRKRWERPDAYRFAAPGTPEAVPPWERPETKARWAAERDALERAAFEREFFELRRDWEELKREIAAKREAERREVEELRRKSDLAFENFRCAFKSYAQQRKYSPDQPRVPAGNPDGGRWTSDGGSGAGRDDPRVLSDATTNDRLKPGAQYAENSSDPFLNKHIIERHVDKTDEELKARIRAEQFPGLFVTAGRDRIGSFDSKESARDFISRTIENNSETVEAVASGKLNNAFLTWRFGYQTGREAILDLDTSTIRMRPTYNVGVVITHDPSSDLGYRVVTAFPRNYNPRVGR